MRVWDALDGLVNTVYVVYFITGVVAFLVLSSVFFGFPVSSSDQPLDTPIECRVYFDGPILIPIILDGKSYTEILMDDCVSQSELGDPSLPVYNARIAIPYGRNVSKVKVIPGPLKPVAYDFVNNPVLPYQKDIPYSEKPDNNIIVNKTKYESTKSVNYQIYSEGEIGTCRGYEILTVYLHPVEYIPKSGKLSYYTNMEIIVYLKDKPEEVYDETYHYYRGTESDKKFLDTIIENPENINSYDSGLPFGGGEEPLEYTDGLCDPEDTYQFVIITSSSLKDTTGYTYNWSDLISHRQSYSGLSGTIVTVEEIDACTDYWNATATFNDTQAHIREFCKDAYQDWETEYVILGGDWDSTEANQIVPFRLFTDRYEGGTYDTMACDKYYSHLDGNWYYSTDSIWGGGRGSGVNDYYGELYVGRITAVSAETVSNAVYKIINYDTNSSLTNDWLSKVSFWGGDLGWTATSEDYMEEIRLGTDTYRTFTGFEEWNDAHPDDTIDTSERLYHADLGAGYANYFYDSVEDDNSSMINHLDHSSWTTPFGMSGWQFIYNTKPFFGYTQGCLGGRFHSGFAGCEQMMCRHEERHAFALVLNTGYGYGSASSTNGASQYIQAFFWDYFFNDQSENQENWQLGKAFMYSSDRMASVFESSSAAWCYAWYSNHFFGDPATTLRISNGDNSACQLSNENPSNSSSGLGLALSLINVTITDQDGDLFNWSIETNPDVGDDSGNNAGNGSKECAVSGLSYGTTYTWYVNVSDGNLSTNASYSFTTESEPVDDPPQFSELIFANGTTGVTTALSTLGVTISDPEGDSFNYSIETSPNIGSISQNGVSNGTKFCSVSGLVCGNEYTWFVNATDNNSWRREWYTFNTRSCYTPNAPGGFSATAVNRTCINLSWTDHAYASTTRVEYNTESDGSWEVGDHNLLYNGSAEITSHTGLSAGTTIYYKAWSWNSTDKLWSSGSTTSETTSINNPPSIGSPSPTNGSTGNDLSFTFSVSITDANSDTFNWTIECSNGESDYGNIENNGTKQLLTSGLSYNTLYTVWVNATDSYDTTNEYYYFTTRPLANPLAPSDFTASADGRFIIALSWAKGNDADKTYIEWSGSQDPWSIGEGTELYNGTGTQTSQTGLSAETTRYYQAWSWNSSDNVWSSSYSSSSATTEPNYAPIATGPSPSNASTGVSISTSSISVTISDFEGESFNWSVYTVPNVGNNSGNDASNGSKTCSISGLSYSTTYYWFVNLTDGNNSRNITYYFTTASEPAPDPTPGGGGVPPVITNYAPTANPGGPYSGLVNQTIAFSGNRSTDSDGTIVSYEWTFGDGYNASGVNVTHIYRTAGSFTVRLTVKDDDGSSGSATTTASISQASQNGTNNSIPSTPGGGNTSNNSKENNTVIVKKVKTELGLNISNNSVVQNVTNNNSYFYLVDTDDDGVVDTYCNIDTKINSVMKEVGDGVYLIDEDGDGEWDYTYNANNDALSSYKAISEDKSEKKDDSYPIGFLWFGFIVSIMIVVSVLFIKRTSIGFFILNKRLKKLKQKKKQFYYMHAKKKRKPSRKPKVAVTKIKEDVDKIQMLYSESQGSKIRSVDDIDPLKSDEIFTGSNLNKLYDDNLKKAAVEQKDAVSALSSGLDKAVMTKDEFISKIKEDIDTDLRRFEEERESDIDDVVDLIFTSKNKGNFGKL